MNAKDLTIPSRNARQREVLPYSPCSCLCSKAVMSHERQRLQQHDELSVQSVRQTNEVQKRPWPWLEQNVSRMFDNIKALWFCPFHIYREILCYREMNHDK
jgi:hypothetical protein